jgi:putative aldouronate transport system substrate-binding protein
MSNLRKKFVMCICFFFCVSVAVFAAGKQEDTGTSGTEMTAGEYEMMEIKWVTSRAIENFPRRSEEDVLTPIWREKTKVKPEVFSIPQGMNSDEWIITNAVAGSLPELITSNAFFFNEVSTDALIEADAIYEITYEMMDENMPLLKKKLNRLGVTLKQFYRDNLRSSDGKLWRIPVGDFTAPAFPELRESQLAVDNVFLPYGVRFRDDILKMIFPNAKSEQEMRELYAEKGELTIDDIIGDIPIRSMEDFTEYFRKVDELGLKVGRNDVIPFVPTSWIHPAGPGCTLLPTMMDIWWAQPTGGLFINKGEELIYWPQEDYYKDANKWLNQLHNQGLIDPETYIQKKDQMVAKFVNGRYAVVPSRMANLGSARDVGKDNGYGWRYFPTFIIPLNTERIDFKYFPVNLNAVNDGVAITKKVKEKDLKQILQMIDWNLSDEADELRFWGPKEFTTGEGINKRFKPQYADLENWAVSGISGMGKKDGPYYGMCANIPNPTSHKDYYFAETHDIMLYLYDHIPQYVYDKEASIDDEIEMVMQNAIKAYYAPQYIYYDKKWSKDEYLSLEDWKDCDSIYGFWGNDAGKLKVQAILGSEENFERNWQKHYDAAYPEEMQETLSKMKAIFKDIYNTRILSELEKAE